jgi:hypothetical protein
LNQILSLRPGHVLPSQVKAFMEQIKGAGKAGRPEMDKLMVSDEAVKR